MHGSQGAGAWALLGLRGAAAVGALGAGEDAARGEDEDVTVGKLLFELAREAVEEEEGMLVTGLREEKYVEKVGGGWLTVAGPCGSRGGEARERR